MINFNTNKNTQINLLFNNILLLCRKRLFYTKFDLIDTFQNRINLIFVHISFIFIKIKQNNKQKKFQQKLFDLVFEKIELNMREIGFGDTTINTNMKFLVKNFYNILLYCKNYSVEKKGSKNMFFIKYLSQKTIVNDNINELLVDYFDKYQAFCFDLSADSVLSGKINFNYKQIYKMAVPKRKTSKSRRNKRRSHHRVSIANVIEDKKSGEFRLSHHVDLKTGLYNGKQILEPKK